MLELSLLALLLSWSNKRRGTFSTGSNPCRRHELASSRKCSFGKGKTRRTKADFSDHCSGVCDSFWQGRDIPFLMSHSPLSHVSSDVCCSQSGTLLMSSHFSSDISEMVRN